MQQLDTGIVTGKHSDVGQLSELSFVEVGEGPETIEKIGDVQGVPILACAGVAIARLASEGGADAAGAGHPVRFFDLDDVIETVDSPELELSESIEA